MDNAPPQILPTAFFVKSGKTFGLLPKHSEEISSSPASAFSALILEDIRHNWSISRPGPFLPSP